MRAINAHDNSAAHTLAAALVAAAYKPADRYQLRFCNMGFPDAFAGQD